MADLLAYQVVEDGYNFYTAMATEQAANANELVGQLVDFANTVPVPNYTVTFNVPDSLGAPFEQPEAPADPGIEFRQIDGPLAVAVPDVGSDIDFGDEPTFDDPVPALQTIPPPAAFTDSAPEPDYELTLVEMPEVPTVALPEQPTLDELQLPELPDITYVEFTETIPELTVQTPPVGFSYSESDYADDLLQEVKDKLSQMVTVGGTGLPADVEAALINRAIQREDAAAQKLVQQAAEEWSSRGFALPQGELQKRVSEARLAQQAAYNTLQREIYIRAHEVEVQATRFAVEQGVALEGLLIQHFDAVAARSLQAAQLTVQLAIDIFNARVAEYNAQLEAVKVSAQVYRDQIQAEATKVEVYRAQIEAERVRGELNQQKVQIYDMQIRALQSTVDLYTAQVNGVRAQIEADQAKVATFRAQVEAYTQQVQAKSAEYDAYKAAIEGEAAKQQVFESQVRAFGSRVQAFATSSSTKVSQKQIEIDVARVQIEKLRANIETFVAQLDAEAKRVTAGVQIYDGQSRMYSALLSAEQARVVADSRQFELSLEQGKSETSLNLQSLIAQGTAIQQAAQISLSAIDAAARTTAQLTAGAMSAVNVSANASGSASDSYSISTQTNYTYTGEI